MKWQEVIEFRSIDNQEMIRALDLESHITDLKPGNRPLQIHLFRHLTLKTDFCLHLVFNSDEPDINGSQLGLTLVAILQEYGLVNHTVWIEERTWIQIK